MTLYTLDLKSSGETVVPRSCPWAAACTTVCLSTSSGINDPTVKHQLRAGVRAYQGRALRKKRGGGGGGLAEGRARSL